jgi:aminopeptidase N
LNYFKVLFLTTTIFYNVTIKTYGQLLKEKYMFTQEDSLRGTVNENRKWWDVVHYALEVQPDFSNFSLKGINTITFRVIDKVANRMQIDLQEPMIIDKIYLDNKLVSFNNDGNVWYILLGKHSIARNKPNKEATQNTIHKLEIHYHGVPKPALHPPWDGGVVWSKDKKGNPWIGTACQGLGASSWWPCKDHQSDKPDSVSIEVRISDTLMNISNGRLASVIRHKDRTNSWKWIVSKPINTYNLTMNIGKYAHWNDTLWGENGLLHLDYYVLEYEIEKAKKQFAQTKPMLRAFENWFGPYPFYKDGYKIVQTSYLGMEHQTAIAYGNNFQNGYNGRDLSKTGQGMKWDFILVHESGHEWFGNNITSKDVADMWIHEGFTNYSECLYMNDVFGQNDANEYIIGLRNNVMNDKPVIGPYGVNKEGSSDMYYKASNMLHTIRQIVDNDSIFRAMLRKMNQQFQYSTTTTQDIESFLIQETGKPLKKVFDQYLRSVKIPVLEYYFSANNGATDLYLRWQNTIEGFNMPLKIPVSKDEMKWVTPSAEWIKVAGISMSTDEFISQLDRNFYIEYKTRKP